MLDTVKRSLSHIGGVFVVATAVLIFAVVFEWIATALAPSEWLKTGAHALAIMLFVMDGVFVLSMSAITSYKLLYAFAKDREQ